MVRSIRGPYICGDGIDIWEDSILTASWVAHDALQVCFITKELPVLCRFSQAEERSSWVGLFKAGEFWFKFCNILVRSVSIAGLLFEFE